MCSTVNDDVWQEELSRICQIDVGEESVDVDVEVDDYLAGENPSQLVLFSEEKETPVYFPLYDPIKLNGVGGVGALRAFFTKSPKANVSCIVDLLYKSYFDVDFENDFLTLLRRGACADFDNGAIHLRYLDGLVKPRPKKSVSHAMFDSFWKNSHLIESTLFVRVDLYCQGYLDGSIDDLRCLDWALFVGGVNPCASMRVFSKNEENTFVRLQALWRQKRYVSSEEFEEYVLLEPVINQNILRRLWGLQVSQELHVLETFVAKNCAIQCEAGSWRNHIIQGWLYHTDEVLEIEALRKILCAGKSNKRLAFFLEEVLGLVFDGWSIDYNKGKHTVTLLSHVKRVGTPRAGTTLVTLVYDLLCQYKEKISFAELAYYAYYEGFWHSAGHERGVSRTTFRDRMRLCKRFLVNLGYFNVAIFNTNLHASLDLQSRMWDAYKQDQRLLSPASYALKGIQGVSAKDVAVIVQLGNFVDSSDYRALDEHIKNQPKFRKCKDISELMEKHLREGPCRIETLRVLCSPDGGGVFDDFWKAAGQLAIRRVGGRLMYSLQDKVFYWHPRDDDAPKLTSRDCSEELFRLLYGDCQSVKVVEAILLMRQKGFSYMSQHGYGVIVRSFEIIGVKRSPPHLTKITTSRKLINLMMMHQDFFGSTPQLCALKKSLKEWEFNACKKVCSWMELPGILLAIWDAYLSVKNQDFYKEKQACTSSKSAEDIIAAELPVVKAFLCKNRRWCGPGGRSALPQKK